MCLSRNVISVITLQAHACNFTMEDLNQLIITFTPVDYHITISFHISVPDRSKMQSVVLASKWIFTYFKIFGIHSSFNSRRRFSLFYQFTLIILTICNCAYAMYALVFYELVPMQFTLKFVTIGEGELGKSVKICC